MRDKTVCFTGHRCIPVDDMAYIKENLNRTIEKLIKQGYCYFAAGGALGFDTLAAQSVLDLKGKYPHIKLILALPCKSQADRWNESAKRIYEQIKKQADKVVCISENYTRGCMHRRNRYLVENSSVCVCYLTKDTGGTAYTVKYAMEHSLNVINII